MCLPRAGNSYIAIMYIIDHNLLREFIFNTFINAGFPKEVSEVAAENLIQADLRGIDSHGCARLSGYIRLTKKGRINLNAKPKVIHETPSTATLDADKGLGLWVSRMAMDLALEKAEKAGSGWVAVKNSSHFGIAAAHAERAVAKGMIGMAMTNASPLVAPAGAKKAYLGTNPICVAVPSGKYDPFIIDTATSAVSNGKIEIASRAGKRVPFGWVHDINGMPTDDPDTLKEGGTLLPLGSDPDHSYHKGYGFGALVDIMTGVLSGASFGRWVPPFVAFLEPLPDQPGEGMGHFLGAWRVDAFQPKDEFERKMERWIEGIKTLEKAPGTEEILIPGEPEVRTRAQRLNLGVPITEKVWLDLQQLKSELSIETELKTL